MKRTVSFIMAIFMLIALAPVSGLETAVQAAESKNFVYEVSKGKATITDFDKDYVGELTVPDTLGAYPVTHIGDYAFSSCDGLTDVIIPDSVVSIGESAFEWCESLLSVTVPDSVTYIGEYAFNGCGSLTSINIPDSVTSLSGGVFFGCKSLKNITIPQSVTSIGDSAFFNCGSLSAITIPDSVTTIGGDAFAECESLSSITLSDSVTSIGSSAFYGTAYYNDPSNRENGALYIGKYLVDADIDSVPKNCAIKSGTKYIADEAFCGCENLISVTIPNSVKVIGQSAFEDCINLASITVPDNTTNICQNAFYDTAYYNDSANWSSRVLYIGNHLIEAKSYIKGSYEVKADTKSIAVGAFADCVNLTEITVPDSVENIGYAAFDGCESLTSIVVSSDNKVYSSKSGVLFNKDRSLLIEYPDAKTETEYVVPDSVSAIGEYAFDGNGILTYISIPDSVTNIGICAFARCNELKSIAIPGSIKSISPYTFDGCGNLTRVTLKSGLTNIGNEAFIDCSNLKVIAIPDSVTDIGEYALGYSNEENVDGFTVYGEKGSAAEIYANDNGFSFANISSHAHSYSPETTMEATCTDNGIKTYACACGDSYTEPISALGHNYGSKWIIDKDPTCTETGSKSKHCLRCGAKKNITIVKANGHSYDEWDVTKAATCTKSGSRKHTCSICGYVEKETIPALGHNYSSEWTIDKAATCNRSGSKSHRCTRCTVKTDITSIPATGHNYTSKVTKRATCGEKGIMTYTCLNCGYSYTKNIAKLSHTYKTTLVKATTSKSGTKTTKCSVCGYVKSTSTIAKISTVKLSTTVYNYNGEVKNPTVTVRDSNGKKLSVGTSYTVKYSSGRKNVGTYTVTVTFKGNYSGTKKLTFKINPRSTSIYKITGEKKQFTAKWYMRAEQVTGYQLQYSTSSSMKNATTKTYANTSTTTKAITGLKSSRTYYVRVRTYKKVKVSGKSTTYYSSWSSVVNVKTK